MYFRRKFSKSHFYVLTRYISLLFSFVLSLIFSSELGLLNRAIAGFVFLTSSLLIIICTQGIGLKVLRFSSSQKLGLSQIRSYIFSSVILILTGLSVLGVCLFVFLSSLAHIRLSIFVVVFLYFILAFSGQLFFDFLLRTSRLTLLSMYLCYQSFFSFALFFCFYQLVHWSVFVSVFTSLGLAFLFSQILTIVSDATLRNLILDSIGSRRRQAIEHKFEVVEQFSFHDSLKSVHLVLLDKLDKILFLSIFSLETFSKIIIAQSFLFILKPAQELMLNHVAKSGVERVTLFRLNRQTLVLVLVLVISLPTSYFFIVDKVLGDEWLLSPLYFLLLLILELFKIFSLTRVSHNFILKNKSPELN